MNVGECVSGGAGSIILQFANACNAATAPIAVSTPGRGDGDVARGSLFGGTSSFRSRHVRFPRIANHFTHEEPGSARDAVRRDRWLLSSTGLEVPARLRIPPSGVPIFGACEQRNALAIPQHRRMR